MIMNDKERVDKHAKMLMLVVSAFIAMLAVIALSGCDRHKDIETYIDEWEVIDIRTDSIDMDSFITYPWYNPDSIMNDVDMDCGE